MRTPGWVSLMCSSSNPKTKAAGEAIKERLRKEDERDLTLLRNSPAYKGARAEGKVGVEGEKGEG